MHIMNIDAAIVSSFISNSSKILGFKQSVCMFFIQNKRPMQNGSNISLEQDYFWVPGVIFVVSSLVELRCVSSCVVDSFRYWSG